jgi:hypothetical protein
MRIPGHSGHSFRDNPATPNYHLKKVFVDSELQEESVIRNFRITAADGKSYNTKHYNLSAIIGMGSGQTNLLK